MTRPASNSPELVEAIEKLGSIREEFRGTNIVAAWIVGPIVTLMGAFVVYSVLRLGRSLDQATVFILGFGGLLIVTGISSIIWSYWAYPHRLLLCHEGLIEVRSSKCSVIPWSSMIGVVENRATEIEKLAIGVGSSRRITWTICYRDGEEKKELELDVSSAKDVERLMQLVHDEMDRRGIIWDKQGVKLFPG
jgi:hypothetical protein